MRRVLKSIGHGLLAAGVVLIVVYLLGSYRRGREVFRDALDPTAVRSYLALLPLAPGKMFPVLGPGGLTQESMRRIPGAQAIPAARFPGLSGSVYALEKHTIQRNLYRIVLE